MIEHVYRRAMQSRLVSRVIIATDDLRIATAVSRFGGEVRLTRADHPSGTDRVAEVASSLDCDIVVGVQGDEPLIDPRAIDEAIAPFAADPDIQITTLYHRITDPAELGNPNIVKVAIDRGGFAMYFSRAPIPYVRDPRGGWPPLYRHIGLYAYRRGALLVLAALDPTPLDAPKRRNSCARSSTASASRPWRRPTTRSAWIHRRISSVSAASSRRRLHKR